MKKIVNILLIVMLAFIPVFLHAEEERTKVDLKDYKVLDFKETLVDEDMQLKNKDYKEDDKQTIIYLFRGRGCGYSRAFLTFLNDISEEYGKYFKVVSFESWYDEDNSKLLGTISEFLEQPAGGVPYIIIGDKVFGGYAETYNDQLKEAIKNEYDKENRYDVFEEYNESIKFHLSETAKIVIWNLVFTIIASTIVIMYVKKSNEKLLNEINSRHMNRIVEKVKEETSETINKVKKVAKSHHEKRK